jgi:ubiquinone/menaquinone biosynthesis C-methylase UbiE
MYYLRVIFLSSEPREYTYAGRLDEATRLDTQTKVVDQIIKRELEILDLKPKMRVLDAGCGTGAITRKIASRVFPAEALGVDIDPLFIEKAREKSLEEGVSNVRFELGNIDNLRYDNGFFDLAYCNVVLMHVKNPVRTVAELERVTKKGGIVAASDTALLIYPPMPRFSDLWLRFGEWANARGMDRYIGRKLYSIFSETNLKSVKIYPIPMLATQQDQDALRGIVYQMAQVLEQSKNTMIREGMASTRDFEASIKETRHFLDNPHSCLMFLIFLAVGEC